MKNAKLLAFSLLVASGVAFYSCSDDDDDGGLPPIGGFNNADEVGEADLVAHWGLNGDGTESKSDTDPNGSAGVTYVNGIKGQGANLVDGFLRYPSIAAMENMTSFSVSSWFKVSNNSGGTGAPSVFFSLTKPGSIGGNINFMAETGWYTPEKDTLVVKGWLISNNALAGQDVRNSPKPTPEDLLAGHVGNANEVAGEWAHGVLTWDNATKMFKVYVNGAKISNPAWELRNPDGSPGFEMESPSNAVLGAFGTFANGTAVEPWDKGMTGQLDEVRVWKRALTQAEIGSLYQLELAGR